MALAGWEEGQVVDAYKFFNHTGVNFYNLLASIGALVLFFGVILVLINAVASVKGGADAGHDPWKGETLEWFALSPPPPHNFDIQPDVRGDHPMRDIRAAIGRQRPRGRGARGPRVAAGSLRAMSSGAGATTASTPRRPGLPPVRPHHSWFVTTSR